MKVKKFKIKRYLIVSAIFALLLLFLLLFIGCNKQKSDGNDKTPSAGIVRKPNIIFILVDTLRVDYVGAYGAKHKTPVFDMLARQGAIFEKAYAPSSWTVPSVASMFTGMYPQSHGLTNGISVVVKVLKQQRIPKEFTTLAESLKGAGYTTFCATANAHLDTKYGYDRGFDHFKMFKFREGHTIEETVESWKPLLENAAKTTGYFLFLHWVDPHHPYEPREPYISRINPDYLNKVGRVLEDTGPLNLSKQGYFKEFPETLDVLKDIYTSEVLWTDASVGRVLKTLPDVGRSMLIFTSDHGEAFGEHKSFFHGFDLFQETVQVPLLMVYPDRVGAGAKISTPVSLVDLPASILGFAGIKPPGKYEGIDLKPVIEGKEIAKRRLWSHLDKNQQYVWHGVWDDSLKYLENFPFDQTTDKGKTKGVPYLYDLSKDPGEKNNLAKTMKDHKARLAGLLNKEMDRAPIVKPVTVDTEIDNEYKEKFKQFGYLGQ